MVKVRTSLENDVDNAARLEEHARNVMATNRRHPQGHALFGRGLDWPTLFLAVVGGAVTIALLGAFLYPLALASYKFWVGA